jgi:hypothetical protein
MQRTKGAVYEREICTRLSAATGRKIQRNIGQARDGGTDIPFGNFLIECKRRKTLGTIEKWLKQATDAVKKKCGCGKYEQQVCDICQGVDSTIPVVVARSDAGESMAFLSLENFLTLVSLANV